MFGSLLGADYKGLLEDIQDHGPILPNVPLLRALWSLLDGIWRPLKGSSGVLGDIHLSLILGSGTEERTTTQANLAAKHVGGCQNCGPLLGPLIIGAYYTKDPNKGPSNFDNYPRVASACCGFCLLGTVSRSQRAVCHFQHPPTTL